MEREYKQFNVTTKNIIKLSYIKKQLEINKNHGSS